MYRGKRTCKILKEIRQEIARANDIDLVTSECRYQGDCKGTCPKCEAEVAYLEQQLNLRRMAGKAVVLSGLVASSWMVPLASQASEGVGMNVTRIDSVQNQRTEVFGSVGQMPSYPGGIDSLFNDVERILESPMFPEGQDDFRVVVQLQILEDGNIGEIKIVRGSNPISDDAVIAAMRKLKRFNPGSENGVRKKMWFTLPIDFKFPK